MIKNYIKIKYSGWDNYELLDSGNQKKLERFGEVVIIRDEKKAWWKPTLPQSHWDKAAAIHSDKKKGWEFKKRVAKEWSIHYGDLVFEARFSANSKHIGIFPEYISNWIWIINKLKKTKRKLKVLNLFAYTGVYSVILAKHGCSVTHVDSSQGIISWAKKNQSLSQIDPHSIRWITDDVMKFITREQKRGNTYDAIIMDPPVFGHGTKKNEIWRIEKNLYDLLSICSKVLSNTPLFLLINLYTVDQSAIVFQNLLEDSMKKFTGTIEIGELVTKSKSSNNLLSLSLYGLWESTL